MDYAGFEGVSWDSVNQRLYVVKEKLPLRVLVVSGLDVLRESPGFNLAINEWKSWAAASPFTSDLSSLSVHEATGHLLLLSGESALLWTQPPWAKPR